MDIDAQLVQAVASAAQARAYTHAEHLLADPEVDVVVVCSPDRFHATQVLAACQAGKRAILCEKPLAATRPEIDTIGQALETHNIPLRVGAMHAIDPGWIASVCHWKRHRSTVIQSSIVLPPNDRFMSVATELWEPSTAYPQGTQTPAVRIRSALLGLAIHDLPLIRQLLPEVTQPSIRCAMLREPFGYFVIAEYGDVAVEFHAVMSSNWEPRWILEAIADDATLAVTFPPSYVHAGSATAVIAQLEQSHTIGPFPNNGYVAEWLDVYDATLTRDTTGNRSALDDIRFALDLTDQIDQFLSVASSLGVSAHVTDIT